MKRGTTPLAQRSPKMKKLYTERRPLVERLLKENPWCEQCIKIQKHPKGAGHRCGLYTADVHELLRRSQGGSILDETNLVCICRPGHDWIGAHPEPAVEIGLSRWSWQHEPDPEVEAAADDER